MIDGQVEYGTDKSDDEVVEDNREALKTLAAEKGVLAGLRYGKRYVC